MQLYFNTKLSLARESAIQRCFCFLRETTTATSLVVTASRLFVRDKKPSLKRACLRNGVAAPSPRRVGPRYTSRLRSRSHGIPRSVPRKQFGPRKLHQSARGADGLKAVTFPADVTGSYFTQSAPTPSSCSLLLLDPPSSSTYLPFLLSLSLSLASAVSFERLLQ